jgi:hypothetical protein
VVDHFLSPRGGPHEFEDDGPEHFIREGGLEELGRCLIHILGEDDGLVLAPAGEVPGAGIE